MANSILASSSPDLAFLVSLKLLVMYPGGENTRKAQEVVFLVSGKLVLELFKTIILFYPGGDSLVR